MSNQDYDPTRRSQAPTNEQIPHSGVHHGEQPVTEFDKTPLRDAPIPHKLPEGITTGHLPEDMRPEVKKSKRGLLIGAGTGLAALALGTGLFLGLDRGGSSNNKTAPNTEVGTSAPANPSAEQGSTSTQAERLDPPAELSPDAIRNLTPTQMAERFRIPADSVKTPEAFAEAYVTRENAFYKLGCTEEDWAPYKGAPRNAFIDAMRAKYFVPVAEAINGFVGDDYNNRAVWNSCNMMLTGGLTNYSYNEQLIPGTVTSEQNPDGTFNVSFEAHAWDNFSQIKKLTGDVTGTNSANQTVIYHMTRVHSNNEGGLVAETSKVENAGK